MTITAQTTKVQYAGTSTPAEEYPVTFKFMEDADLAVIHTNVDDEDALLTLDADYTVSGAGDDEGGTVTVTNSDYRAGAGERLTIYLDMDIKQETDLQNSATFYPEVIETALDRLTLAAQQLENANQRVLKVSESSELSSVECETPEAGKALMWNATADGIVNGVVDASTLTATARREELTAGDGQTLFELTSFTYTPSADNLAVYVDGVLLDSTEYEKTSTSSFTLSSPAVEGEVVTAVSVALTALSDLNAATDAAQAAQAAAEAARVAAEASQTAAEEAEAGSQAQAAAAAGAASSASASASEAAGYAALVGSVLYDYGLITETPDDDYDYGSIA